MILKKQQSILEMTLNIKPLLYYYSKMDHLKMANYSGLSMSKLKSKKSKSEVSRYKVTVSPIFFPR